jgi:superfamily II DNA or RNA helicase
VAAADPSLQAEVGDLWEGVTPSASALLELAGNVHEALLLEIDRACRLWPALEPCLDQTTPSGIELTPEQVVELLSDAAPLLTSAGISLRVPPEISVSGRQRLRARLRGRSQPGTAAGESSGRFALAQVLSVCWEAALGDQSISIEELRKLAEAKRPLVRFRDRWLVVDPAELAGVLALLERPPETLEGAAALRAVIAEEAQGPGGRIGELAIEAGDALFEVLEELRAGAVRSLDEVPGLRGTLRPYQTVGTAWLEQLGRLGLGACLADDMGLGKTVQVIAYLLRRRAAATPDAPSLLICPTSVLGNWERELHRFAPEIPVLLHHGPDRKSTAEELASAAGPGGVVVTSYGVLRSDTSLLASLTWDVAALDEAQFIKNHRAKVAQAAFQLRARHRIALTGTPVENRLTDLWSIFAFTNPGLLGGVTRFKKEIAGPVERFRDPHALARLQRLTSPFILRRTKSDPDIVPELPPRIVLRSECSLTREQASLYQATLDAAMDKIESSDGIDRRGKVLALITALKQICNHPAQFLREHDASTGRSGKLRRLGEELETALAEGDAALLFTQYRAMGEILVRFIEERFALTAPFLHGGVSRSQREAMVARFQKEDGPPVMVVSVKAGGTGINLTRASHVVHVDRWWNPAVEAQATDRAHRIGQTRTVVVHTLVTAGTLEERIDKMLEEKAELARLAVAGGEQWLTELDDAGLRELLALDPKTAGGSSNEEEEEVAP